MDAPIVVLGNGPVGQTAALLLARWGVPVVLLDQRPHRDPVGSKAIVQQRDVLDVWEAVGAGRRIADEGLTWTVARTFYRDRELFNHTFADPGHSPFPPFVNISQARTEQILDERIAATPLIDVRWSHQVTGITQHADGVMLHCGDRAIAASYVVACAGARGDAVRRMLGVSFDGHSFDDRFLICDIRTDLPGWANERRFYFDPPWNPGRQVLIHPCPDSTFRIDWQIPASETGTDHDARIRAVIGERPYELVWSSVYRFQSRVVDRMRVGRVLLAGDLAHLVAPFGARGLNSGVQDAENAAWKLAFVHHGWASDTLLASYHTERHAAALENLDVTGATMRFLVPGTPAEHRHRLTALESGDRAAVDSGRLAEPYWYVDSPLTTPHPDYPFAGRPPRGGVPPPGPGILIPDWPITVDGQPGRLRAIARDGLLLLAGDRVGPFHVDTGAPIRTLRVAEVPPDELWIVRPDAHVAAVLTTPVPSDVAAAVRRALATPPAAPHLVDQGSFDPLPGSRCAELP